MNDWVDASEAGTCLASGFVADLGGLSVAVVSCHSHSARFAQDLL